MENEINDRPSLARLDLGQVYSEPKRTKSGSVSYMDGSVLQRPFQLPRKYYPVVAVIAVIAVVIGIYLAMGFNRNVVHSDDRARENFAAIVERGVTQDLPVLTGFVYDDDGGIQAKLNEAGLAYVDMKSVGSSSDSSMDIFKVPSDVPVEEAVNYYAEGINSLDSATAAKLLSGAWRLTVDRDYGFSYNLKYADFSSSTPQAAIEAAIASQGLAESQLGETGTDAAGNVYQQGSIVIDDTTYYWNVSVCPLTDVYSVTGIPESAQYVGVRLNS